MRFAFAEGIGAATFVAAAIAGGVRLVNPIFGIYDSTADELADLLGIDDAPPAAVSAARFLRPVYEPLKALAPSCTDALFPEFNDDLDMNDCLLLPRRVLWRGGTQPPLVIRQTMGIGSLFSPMDEVTEEQSPGTGSSADANWSPNAASPYLTEPGGAE